MSISTVGVLPAVPAAAGLFDTEGLNHVMMAGPLVKLGLVVLIVFSVVSWASIFMKIRLFKGIARIPADGRRPLAADRTQIERLYALRQAAYANAHLRIDARGAQPEDVAERIIERIGEL